MRKTTIIYSLFVIGKLCTVNALCSSTNFDITHPAILSATAEFLYSSGINTIDDAKNYGHLNTAVTNSGNRPALKESYKHAITSLNVSLIAKNTAWIEDGHLDKLATLYLNLKDLNFSRCEEMTDDTLQKWISCFPKVTSVNLEFCKKITDRGVNFIAQHYPELEEVSISDGSSAGRLRMQQLLPLQIAQD